MSKSPGFDPYEVLGITKEATEQEIKDSYRNLSKKYHTDNLESGNREKFEEIKKAYDLLINPSSRRTYEMYGVEMDFAHQSRLIAVDLYCQIVTIIPLGVPISYALKDKFENEVFPSLSRDMNEKKKRYEKLSTRFGSILEKPEEDFLSPLVLQKIRDYESSYKEAWLVHDLHREAFRLLTKYKFDLDQLKAPEEDQKERKVQAYYQLPSSFQEFCDTFRSRPYD